MTSIRNITKDTVIASSAAFADTFLARMVGLLNRRSLGIDEALIITRCQSIHMFFMRFSIDVIFVDHDDRVTGLVERIKPFRLSPIFFKSSYAIELCPGVIAQSRTSLNDKIEINNSNN